MRDISILKQRILQYLDFKDISKYKFYQDTGLSNGILSQNNGLSEENTLKVLSYFSDINPTWLLTGEGEMLRVGKADNIVKVKPKELSKPKSIPLIPINAVAGFGAGEFVINESDIERRYVIAEFDKADFMIRVSGNSMIPYYLNGDILACQHILEINFIQFGRVFVIDTEQGVLVKRLHKSKNEDEIICYSDNKEQYSEFVLPKSTIRSYSLVIGLLRLD